MTKSDVVALPAGAQPRGRGANMAGGAICYNADISNGKTVKDRTSVKTSFYSKKCGQQ